MTAPSDTATGSVPGWLTGVLAATAALVAPGFVSMGFFASGGGIAIAGAVAIAVGAAAAAGVAPARAPTNASIVAFYVLALAAAYLLILPALTPPGAQGGPAVYAPAQTGGAPAQR